ncbi:MAG: M35 family metallo-endopeptidase [Polaromonas sp.]|uniref:M35 family metallo-endopeptidase n=1 Tax=Polaromonas sp. TaxID=1869339 RepID=UPI00272EEC5F|nr:M35 family metallo-endopeptidase [Polaromonas sp.]MDP2450965.1 M35 family metallo-endopeptidase [Polaromonas sp.]MDP3248473.1 M35 family metallo-endopeptidase [Polaromonas sp.]MDP3757443.1 M35 family metallo-endopeptidase [Polaromonas sp.]
MPIGNYTGTPNAHRIDLHVLTGLYNEAEAIIAFATANPNPDLKTKWFGSRNTTAAVQHGLTALNNYVLAAPVDIESKNQATLGMSDLLNPNRQILIGWWFSLSWFNTGERVQTIIHELAHKALNAKDKKLGEDYCYKHKALELANHPSKYAEALDNAENWAYFIANHRFLMPHPPLRNDPAWSSIIAANVDAKGQPGGLLMQDPAIIDANNPRW